MYMVQHSCQHIFGNHTGIAVCDTILVRKVRAVYFLIHTLFCHMIYVSIFVVVLCKMYVNVIDIRWLMYILVYTRRILFYLPISSYIIYVWMSIVDEYVWILYICTRISGSIWILLKNLYWLYINIHIIQRTKVYFKNLLRNPGSRKPDKSGYIRNPVSFNTWARNLGMRKHYPKSILDLKISMPEKIETSYHIRWHNLLIEIVVFWSDKSKIEKWLWYSIWVKQRIKLPIKIQMEIWIKNEESNLNSLQIFVRIYPPN